MCNMIESDLFILLIGQIDGQEISAAAVLPPRVISRPRRSPPRRPPRGRMVVGFTTTYAISA
jgi:hypothetical protein